MLCEVSCFKRAKESRFYYVLSLFGFNMCTSVLVKSQVDTPTPQTLSLPPTKTSILDHKVMKSVISYVEVLSLGLVPGKELHLTPTRKSLEVMSTDQSSCNCT